MTVIEASAGTGKTYQITDLVTRLVAERGIPMREIVVVTFTRAATAELKDRIRSRLTEGLEAIEASGSSNPDLEAFVHRCVSIPEAADRLRGAQRDFDQALISTIHGFCQRTIDGQGFECGADSGLQLLSDTGELLEEIVDDWLSERLRVSELEDYQALVQEAGFTREGLLKLARAATQDPDTPVHPAPEDWTEDRFSAQLSALSTRRTGGLGLWPDICRPASGLRGGDPHPLGRCG
jgi:exodeoxyribonuclease V beta subunit